MSMGGGGGGGTTRTELPPHVTAGQQFLYNQARGLYGGPQPQLYPGRTYAAPSLEHYGRLGKQYATQYAGETLPGLIGTAQGILPRLAAAGDPSRDIYLQRAVGGALGQMGRQFAEQVMPAMRASTAGSRAFGHARLPMIEAQVAERTARGMGDVASQMYSDAYRSGLSAMAQGAQLAPSLAQLGMAPAGIYQQIAGRQLAEEQQAIDEAMMRYQYQQELPWQTLSRYGQVTGLGGIGGGGAGTTTQKAAGQSPLAGMAGGALAGGGLGSALGSAGAGTLAAFPGLAGMAAIPGIGWLGAGLGALLGMM